MKCCERYSEKLRRTLGPIVRTTNGIHGNSRSRQSFVPGHEALFNSRCDAHAAQPVNHVPIPINALLETYVLARGLAEYHMKTAEPLVKLVTISENVFCDACAPKDVSICEGPYNRCRSIARSLSLCIPPKQQINLRPDCNLLSVPIFPTIYVEQDADDRQASY